MKTPDELLQESLKSFEAGQWVKFENKLCKVESPNLAAGKLMLQEVDATGTPMGELMAVSPFVVKTPSAAELRAVAAEEIVDLPEESISALPVEIAHGKVEKDPLREVSSLRPMDRAGRGRRNAA